MHPSTLAPPTPPPPRKEKKIAVEVVEQAPKAPSSEATGPIVHTVKDDREYVKVVIVWRDSKGREKTTSYVMSSLELREDVEEKFTEAARKQTRIRLNLEGDVLEKS